MEALRLIIAKILLPPENVMFYVRYKMNHLTFEFVIVLAKLIPALSHENSEFSQKMETYEMKCVSHIITYRTRENNFKAIYVKNKQTNKQI